MSRYNAAQQIHASRTFWPLFMHYFHSGFILQWIYFNFIQAINFYTLNSYYLLYLNKIYFAARILYTPFIAGGTYLLQNFYINCLENALHFTMNNAMKNAQLNHSWKQEKILHFCIFCVVKIFENLSFLLFFFGI